MKRRFFLTSLIVAGLIRPALAETFPADGYMQEDKTYENAATYTNTGVYDGSVTATAEYTDNVYNILAGTYLPAGAEIAETCEAGSFCPGKTDATYDESAPQGITACPTGYPNSAAGAGAENQCYTACTVTTANIAHATSVSGNDYFGDGADTCVATDCDPGYHVNSELKIVDKTPVIPVDYAVFGSNTYAALDAEGKVFNSFFTDKRLTEPNTWASYFDYGTVYGHASCQPLANAGFMYLMVNIEAVMSQEMSIEDFKTGLAAVSGEAKAAYMADLLTGMLDGTRAEQDLWDSIYVLFASEPNANYTTDSTGLNCYCQITGYTPTDGDFESATNAPWVFIVPMDSETDCASTCSASCAYNLQANDASSNTFRAAMFDARELVEGGGTCAANEIKINWTDADESDIIANEAGMCTFGGDIRTPVKAVAKKGKTFKGWKFEKSN